MAKHTKIVATLGPSVDSAQACRRLLQGGVDVVRLNLAHGSFDEHAERIRRVRAAAARLRHMPVILADLPGPKLRIGKLRGGTVQLRDRSRVTLRVSQGMGSEEWLPVTRDVRLSQARPGQLVRLADGAVLLEVVRRRAGAVACRVVHGGDIRSRCGLSVPSGWNRPAVPTAADREAIRFCVKHRLDWIGVSFVRSAAEMRAVRRLASGVNLLAKIETPEALKHLEDIVRAADGVMIARGDLGVETPPAEIPFVQKRIIATCLRLQRPVITATQMLESMIDSAQPTRAEVTDIANAVLDGTDAVMLSGETSIGAYPHKAVRVLRDVIVATEKQFPHGRFLSRRAVHAGESISDTVSRAACQLAFDQKVKALVVLTGSGSTALRVASQRPAAPVMALTTDRRVARQLQLAWGVCPVLTRYRLKTDSAVTYAIRLLKQWRWGRRGDRVILVKGIVAARHGQTNSIGVRFLP